MSVFTGGAGSRFMRLGLLAGTALVLGACTERGLPGKNVPHEQARTAPWSYSAYETTPAAAQLYEIDGRRWQITGGVERMPQSMLRPIGSVNGTEMMALGWDEAPYDRLYTASANGSYSVVTAID